MTNNETIQDLKYLIQYDDYGSLHKEAIELAIKALERESCEDAISKQAALEAIEDDASNGVYSYFCSYEDAQKFKDRIKALPPVTPIRPKGEWETGYTYPDGVYWKCSVCEELIRVRIPMHFCSNSGSKMIRKRRKNEDKKLQV